KPVYIRLRREKTNLFLCIDPKDTMTDVKVKLCGALKLDKTPDNIRLLMPTQWDNKYDLLEDAWTMSKANLSNDALVYFVFFDSNRGRFTLYNELLVPINSLLTLLYVR
ncbi:hypothetical protein J3Q64DRAFT_1632945, partial [Phycomyces blakesleeanus]